MKFECDGEINTCLGCPLPDCIRGTDGLKAKKKYSIDRENSREGYKGDETVLMRRIKREMHDMSAK